MTKIDPNSSVCSSKEENQKKRRGGGGGRGWGDGGMGSIAEENGSHESETQKCSPAACQPADGEGDSPSLTPTPTQLIFTNNREQTT